MVEQSTQTPDTRRLIQPPHVLLQDLAGEAVLLNLDNGQYYGLDGISFQMYQLLIASDSIEATFQQLLREYDVEPDSLRGDLGKFVEDLLQNGLVLIAEQ